MMTPRKVCSMLAAALMLALPASAHAGVLYSQIDHASTTNYPSDDYPGAPNASLQVADDFTVPAGQSWQISQVDTLGAKDPQALAPTMNAFLYSNSGGLPGAELFRQTGISASHAPNYTVPLGHPPKLSGGTDGATYWVSIQQAGATFMAPSWYWSERSAQSGNGAAVINPGGASTAACTSWISKRLCSPADLNPDQLFSLSGSAASDPVAFAGLTRNTHAGTATLKVKVPGPGALKLVGKDVVPQSRENPLRAERTVFNPGTYKLLVTARGKARAKLNRRGRVKVFAAAVYTSDGASPTSRTKKIILKKR